MNKRVVALLFQYLKLRARAFKDIHASDIINNNSDKPFCAIFCAGFAPFICAGFAPDLRRLFAPDLRRFFIGPYIYARGISLSD